MSSACRSGARKWSAHERSEGSGGDPLGGGEGPARAGGERVGAAPRVSKTVSRAQVVVHGGQQSLSSERPHGGRQTGGEVVEHGVDHTASTRRVRESLALVVERPAPELVTARHRQYAIHVLGHAGPEVVERLLLLWREKRRAELVAQTERLERE